MMINGEWNANYKHNMYHSSTYKAWNNMLSHAKEKKYKQNKITVAISWKNDFRKFLKDMGEKPEGCVLTRINLSLGFNKYNCIWLSRKEVQQYRKQHSERVRELIKSLTHW